MSLEPDPLRMGWSHSSLAVELPPHDTRSHIKDRVAILAASRDPVYRLAYQEYIASAGIDDFAIIDDIVRNTPPFHQTVFRGDVYDKRYMVIRKFDSGRFVSVWVAVDLNTYSSKSHPTCEHVLLKFCRAEIHCSIEVRNEIALKHVISKALEAEWIFATYCPVHRAYRAFNLQGTGGQHICLVAERMRCPLRHLIGATPSGRLPVPTAQQIARDLVRALDFLHRRCHLVHTDVNPSSVLVAADDKSLLQGRCRDLFNGLPCSQAGCDFPLPVVKLGGLGRATHVKTPSVLVHVGTINYRAPEVVLGMHYHTSFDIWSAACTIFEVFTGTKLFDIRCFEEKGFDETSALLASVTKILGGLPESMRDLPQARLHFDDDGRLRRYPDLVSDQWTIRSLLESIHGFQPKEATAIESFLLPMLEIDPSRRVDAQTLLRHPWLQAVIHSSVTD